MWISFDEVIIPFSSSLDALQNSHKQESMNNTPTQCGISIVCKKSRSLSNLFTSFYWSL